MCARAPTRRARACPRARPVAQTGHGPFGCNLFVFHIPNDMTNMDLYSLFIPFGNVISVRIMIEKETGARAALALCRSTIVRRPSSRLRA